MRTALFRVAVAILIGCTGLAGICADNGAYLTVEVSEVRICWNSAPDRLYQVQRSTTLAGDDWTGLGSPVAGIGASTCVTDPVSANHRFYRVCQVGGETNGAVISASIQISAVRVCWNSVSNATYSVPYRLTLNGGAGTNLGPPVVATGEMTCVTNHTTDPLESYSVMILIPAGEFTMGDTFAEGYSDERPTHTVYVSAFYMDRTEVTKAMWHKVFGWATNSGYSFDYGALGKAFNHPAHAMTWYDAVKWCNARSEREGRVPAYYTNAAQTAVYRGGQVDVQNDWVKWDRGYRLPTEAEWEKADRGGAAGRRFPWSDTNVITHSRANYYSDTYYAYDISPTRGYHPTFATGNMPYTSPAGYFPANDSGLYDMAGNVWEWCWDWHGGYTALPATDPRGPVSGSFRVFRGGSWYGYAVNCRSAYRFNYFPPGWSYGIGFRSVLPPGQ